MRQQSRAGSCAVASFGIFAYCDAKCVDMDIATGLLQCAVFHMRQISLGTFVHYYTTPISIASFDVDAIDRTGLLSCTEEKDLVDVRSCI